MDFTGQAESAARDPAHCLTRKFLWGLTMTEEATDRGGDETFRFVLTVDGDTKTWAKFTTETFVVGGDGSVREAGPKLSRESENVLTALFDAGDVLQTLSLSTGIALFAKTGDLKGVVGLIKVAKGLGITIADLSDIEAVPA